MVTTPVKGTENEHAKDVHSTEEVQSKNGRLRYLTQY